MCRNKDCQQPIHPKRLEISPNVTTCGKDCARENRLEVKRRAARKQRERIKELTEGVKGPVMQTRAPVSNR